jgi:SAM-dependent methyltransferase
VVGADPLEFYLQEGAALRRRIERFLPPEWTFEGKRVLDFGCGSARVLRHFLGEAQHAELWGCDIDQPSIDWVRANLSPPVRCFQNTSVPPLPLEDGYFDLIWATSVFTHIDRWSTWLVELHRILAPEGILIASFLGEGMWEALVKEPYREDEVGMTVLRHWESGDAGPDVLHSEWWLRAHWGRAFEILEVARPPRQHDGSPQISHSFITLCKRPGEFTKNELERCDPAEPREIAALQTNVRLCEPRSTRWSRTARSARSRRRRSETPCIIPPWSAQRGGCVDAFGQAGRTASGRPTEPAPRERPRPFATRVRVIA